MEWLKLGNAHLKKHSCQCYTNLWRCQWNSLARKCHPKASPASSGGTAYAFHLLPGIVYHEHQANNCSFLAQILYENVVTVECVRTSRPLGSFQLLSHSALSPFIPPDQLDGSMTLSSPRFSHLFASTIFSAFTVCWSLLFCSP